MSEQPEYVMLEPCGMRVYLKVAGLVGFCTKPVRHEGNCSHIAPPRKVHYLRVEHNLKSNPKDAT